VKALSRRGLLQAGTAIGGGLTIGVWIPTQAQARAKGPSAPKAFTPNAWIRVTPDDRVQFVLNVVEMGQGVVTSHAMMVAEELFVAPEKLECVFAEANRAYDNPAIGYQMTGGSTSVKTAWQPLRTAAATAREMLIAAAGRTWKVPAKECIAEDGAVVHPPSNRRLRYGELTQNASQSDTPSVKLRTKDFRIIGKSIDRLDARPKVDGSAVYGMDVKLPGMKIAVVVRSPVFGGKVQSFKAEEAKAFPGVEAVVELPSGVAVVAARYWQALRASKLLEITWDEGPMAGDDSTKMLERYRAALKGEEGKRVRDEGAIEKGFAEASKVVEAEYTAPYVAHATMEPMNATASLRDGRLQVWSGAQGAGGPLEYAQRVTGLSADKITIHQCWAGGGFGRRGQADFVEEAVRLTVAINAPVKVIWSRTDDLQHDFYRPMAVNTIRGGVSADGKITAWHHRTATQSIMSTVLRDLAAPALPNGLPPALKNWIGARAGGLFNGGIVDNTSVEGANDIPYELPNLAVDYVQVKSGVPVGFWRSVGHSHQAFVVESFLDELASAAGKDPYELRRGLLSKKDRHRGVLELAAQKAGWGSALPAGVFRGIAVHYSFGSYAAAVAEVSVTDAAIKVHRIVMAIDCGVAINPDIIRSQLESSAVYGLSSALKHEITLQSGRVTQSNFHDFPLLRMHESPKIESYVVPSEADPTGVGEPGVPVIAPAVANAVFAATGKRLRSLPLRLA
jgi:isoquinoline 1-oxidoreductase beta subunit